MRVTKEPEVRKQEILDTALKLFGENGYEKTSITDIAKAIGVAQGLCYRYFPSKEALFDSAIEEYADVLVEQFAGAEKDDHKTLRQIIEDMPATMEERDTKYYSRRRIQEIPRSAFSQSVRETGSACRKIAAASSAERRNSV